MKQRKYERYDCDLAIRIRAEKTKQWHEARLKNVSAGGALIRCAEAPVHYGERVEIEVPDGKIRIPATVTYAEEIEFVIDEEDIEVSEVRWSDHAAGLFGVKFDAASSKIAAQLIALVEQKKT